MFPLVHPRVKEGGRGLQSSVESGLRIASIEWVTERDVRASEVGLPNASLWWMYRELPQVLLVAVEDLQELLGIAAFVDGRQRGLLFA